MYFLYLTDDIQLAFETCKNVKVQRIDEDPLIIKNAIIVFVGNNERKLMNIEFTFQRKYVRYVNNFVKK